MVQRQSLHKLFQDAYAFDHLYDMLLQFSRIPNAYPHNTYVLGQLTFKCQLLVLSFSDFYNVVHAFCCVHNRG